MGVKKKYEIELSEKIYNDFQSCVKKRFLLDDISGEVESLIIRELNQFCERDYEVDFLTGCFTRSRLRRELENQTFGKGWDDHSVYEERFLCVDIEDFKKYIDQHDMQAGDKLLRLLSDQLRKTYGAGDVYRYGGDEFVVLIGNQEVCLPPLENEAGLKYSVVVFSVSRNQKKMHHINNEMFFYLEKGVEESTREGTNFVYVKLDK